MASVRTEGIDMNVQELIDKLLKVGNKDLNVKMFVLDENGTYWEGNIKMITIDEDCNLWED